MDVDVQDELKLREGKVGKHTQGVVVTNEMRRDKSLYVIPRHYQPLVSDILITRGEIHDRIEKVAKDIFEFYAQYPEEDVALLCALNGANLYFETLTRTLRLLSSYCDVGLKRPVYLEHFIKATSYKNMTRQGTVDISSRHGLGSDAVMPRLIGKHVLVVEDILDSGHTLRNIVEEIKRHQPKSVATTVLFAKRAPNNGFEPDWVAFDVPNEFVVGFGCDLNDRFRDLDHLCTISESGKQMYCQFSSPAS